MDKSEHILVVDDNPQICDLLRQFLTKEGYRISTAGDGREMCKVIAESQISLVILDVMLPGEDGLSLCRELRSQSNIPVIMLTAKGDEIDRILGLEMGADDYVAKPFSTRELFARIKAVLRRVQSLPDNQSTAKNRYIKFANWSLDTAKRELQSEEGIVVPLSTGEYDLLVVMIQYPQHVLNRDQLLDLARGRAANIFDRSIDTQVSRLRRKIEVSPKEPELIKTVWGGGYIFTPEVTYHS
jgi:two-component system OmpR family response regulator